jgi:acetyl esterase/lipase
MFDNRRRARQRAAIFIIALILSLAACQQTPSVAQKPPATPSPTPLSPTPTLPPPQYAVTMQRNVAYGPITPAETLDLCQPLNAPIPHPAIMFIHGGGWSAGDKQQYDPVCQYFAAEGYVAATINYRLAPASTWPAQLVDAQLAMRWLRAQADQLQLDPQRLCAFGDSAGGHLAVFLGALTTIHPGDEAQLLANQSPQASCVVDEFGPVNLIQLASIHPDAMHSLFGGPTPQSDPALYRDASPIFAISPQTSPMIIVQGTQDTTVPPSQSQELQQALQQNHVPVVYISYNGGHEFSGLDAQQAEAIRAQIFAILAAHEHP